MAQVVNISGVPAVVRRALMAQGGITAVGRFCLQLKPAICRCNALFNTSLKTLSATKSMKKNLDTTLLFRWDSRKEDFLRQLARRRGISTSAYLRLLLDSFVAKRGFCASSASSSSPFVQTEFAYGN